jgi:diguanylate cyclase (GGDEF)-like protein/PAS domain S-box-containing protein
VRDETDRWRSERRYRVAFETDPAPSVIVRLADLWIVQANEGMSELTGIDHGRLTSRLLTALKPLHQSDDLDAAIERLRGGERIHKLKRLLRAADGTEVHALISARAIEVDGQACGIFTCIDISDLETAQREHLETQERLRTTLREHADEKVIMAYLAIIDPLTRVLNRRGLSAQLAEELLRAQRYGSAFSVLLLDLHHFKAVNDEFGHDAGDAALLEVAQLLEEVCREPDIAGRWGGEEFMVILPESGPGAARDVASRVRERMEHEEFAGVGPLTASIGVASNRSGNSAESLLKRADRALYAAKSGGRNRVEVAPAHQAEA